jgi:S1-C subfamily serine protease
MIAAKYDQLLKRAGRALGTNSPAEAVRKVRAIVGARHIPNSELEAQKALEALQNGNVPTPAEIMALEIVIRLMRPVMLSRGGALDDLPETANNDLQPTELKDAWSAFRDKIRPCIGSIGRIEGDKNVHVGTGFVVGDGLIATNRHVLAVLTSGSEALMAGTARIVFKQEAGAVNSSADIGEITEIAEVHPRKDIAILRAVTGQRPPLEFVDAIPDTGERIATIGFPGKDDINNPLFLTSIFDGKFGVKSAALGEVLDGTDDPDIFHDCSTTQGNSGSPVFAVPSGKVAGIHRSEFFMYRNEAVGSAEITKLL